MCQVKHVVSHAYLKCRIIKQGLGVFIHPDRAAQGKAPLGLCTLLTFPRTISPCRWSLGPWDSENQCGDGDKEIKTESDRDTERRREAVCMNLPLLVSPLFPWTRCYGNRGGAPWDSGGPWAGCPIAGHRCSVGGGSEGGEGQRGEWGRELDTGALKGFLDMFFFV